MSKRSIPKTDKDARTYAVGSLIFSLIAWFGLGFLMLDYFPGFMNATAEDPATMPAYGIFEFVPMVSIRKFLHLSAIPTLIGLIVTSLERMPFGIGKAWRKLTPSSRTIAKVTFYNYCLQLTPALLNIKYFYGERAGEQISPTWFSDIVMIDLHGYAILTMTFIIGLVSGMLFVLFGWINGPSGQNFGNVIFTFIIIGLSVIAFKGLGHFEGFFAKYGVASADEYVDTYGFWELFSQGPIKDYAHLVVLPAFAGLLMFAFYSLPKILKKGADYVNVNLNIRDQKAKSVEVSRLSKASTVIIAIQLIPAILGVRDPFDLQSGQIISPTWLSDLVMVTIGGYILLSVASFMGYIIGFLRAIVGGPPD